MTAEQWVKHINETEDSQYSAYDCNFKMMERYANYRTKELMISIFRFRDKLAANFSMIDRLYLKNFDNHFGIKETTYINDNSTDRT